MLQLSAGDNGVPHRSLKRWHCVRGGIYFCYGHDLLRARLVSRARSLDRYRRQLLCVHLVIVVCTVTSCATNKLCVLAASVATRTSSGLITVPTATGTLVCLYPVLIAHLPTADVVLGQDWLDACGVACLASILQEPSCRQQISNLRCIDNEASPFITWLAATLLISDHMPTIWVTVLKRTGATSAMAVSDWCLHMRFGHTEPEHSSG